MPPFFAPYGWSLHRTETPLESSERGAESSLWDDPGGLLTVSRATPHTASFYRLRFFDQLIFDVLPNERLIIERSSPSVVSQATRNHILADQILPRVLTHDGSLVLHAGAIQCNQNAVIFVGQSGSGKSSMVASFDQAGCPLMGDDALLISDEGGVSIARAVYPSLRLFQDSIKAVCAETVATEMLAEYTSKRRIEVPLVAGTPAAAPLPIEAIFFLGEPSKTKRIQLRQMSIAETCMGLVSNSFALDPSDTRCARERLSRATVLARRVSAHEISYPHDYARLPQVRETILAQLVGSFPAT